MTEDWTAWTTALLLCLGILGTWFAVKEYRAIKDPRDGDTLSEGTRAWLRKLPEGARIPVFAAAATAGVLFWVWFFIHIAFQSEGIL